MPLGPWFVLQWQLTKARDELFEVKVAPHDGGFTIELVYFGVAEYPICESCSMSQQVANGGLTTGFTRLSDERIIPLPNGSTLGAI